MNLKLVMVICNEEKIIHHFINKFTLPFNTLLHGLGTASQGILDFLGLSRCEKNILLTIVPDALEKRITKYLREEVKIQKIGRGVAFTMPISSAPKYIEESFSERKGDKMESKYEYHLVVAIVNEGNAEKTMNIAKKNGANGGTLIKGRGLGGKNSFKLFNLTVEPEKDIILIVCKNEDKNKIMKAILDKNGINTDVKGVCFSIPISSTIGIDE